MDRKIKKIKNVKGKTITLEYFYYKTTEEMSAIIRNIGKYDCWDSDRKVFIRTI